MALESGFSILDPRREIGCLHTFRGRHDRITSARAEGKRRHERELAGLADTPFAAKAAFLPLWMILFRDVPRLMRVLWRELHWGGQRTVAALRLVNPSELALREDGTRASVDRLRKMVVARVTSSHPRRNHNKLFVEVGKFLGAKPTFL